MTTWGVTVGCVLLALGVSACGGDGGGAAPTTTDRAPATSPTTSTAPERQSSTTTTAYDPTSVEGEVEAAYLRSWDVYADAVYNLELDEEALAEVYAGEALSLRRQEIERRESERRASLVRVEHNYQVVVTSGSTAEVIDNFINHQVRIDAATKAPVEPDPDEPLVVRFRMERIGANWFVVFIEKVNV